MADVHGVPDESMVTPVFTSSPGDMQDLSALAAAAEALSGPGGPRQSAAEQLLYSPQGFSSGGGTSGYDITYGFSGEPDESWANNVQAAAVLETPIQGTGDYPGTT